MIGHQRICAVAVCGLGMQTAQAHTQSTWNGSSGNWSDSARWSSYPEYPKNGQPTAGDTYSVAISSGTVTRDTTATISLLNLSGGTVAGSSTLTVSGATTWSGGRFETGDVNLNGGLSITGATVFYGSSAELILAGGQTASITGSGSLGLEYQTKVTNNGTFYARNDNAISEIGSFQSNFTNAGTFTRDTTAGTFTIGATQFHNTGTLNVNTGTLNLTHGITNSGAIQIAGGAILQLDSASDFNAGTSFSGAGQLQVLDNEQNFRLSLAIPNAITLASGGQISIYDGHALTLNGTLTWSGGILSRESNFYGGDHGYVTINDGATISNDSKFYGLTITNVAASNVSLASGTLLFKGDAIFQNAGNFTMQASTVMDKESATSGNQFNNSGVLTVAYAAAASSKIKIPLINSGTVNSNDSLFQIMGGGSSTGTFHAASGASINWAASYDFHAGAAFTGPGAFSFFPGTYTFDESVSFTGAMNVLGTLSLPPGVTITDNGALYFSGATGFLSGGGVLMANNTLQLGSGTINGSVLTNSSGSVANHVDDFFGNTTTLTNGGVFQNNGTFLAKDSNGFVTGAGSGNTFVNAGTFTRNTASGVYTLGTKFSNSGVVNVHTGTLQLTSGGTSTGGTWSVDASAKLEISGDYSFAGSNTTTGAGHWVFGTEAASQPLATHNLAGTLSLAAPITLGNAKLVIGAAANVTSTGAFNALSGVISGGGAFHSNGGTILGNLTVDGATLSLGAGPNHVHASVVPLDLTNSGVLTNAGSFLAQGDHDYLGLGEYGIAPGVGAGNAVINSGTFTRNTGVDFYAVGVPFNNSGTVSSQSGVLRLDSGGTSTDGTWETNGGLLQLVGDFAFNGTTTLSGPGYLQLGAGTHTVNGPIHAASGLAVHGPANLAVQAGQTVTVGGLLYLLPDAIAPNAPPTLSGGGTVLANGGIDFQAAIIDGMALTNAAGQSAIHATALPITLQNGGVIQNPGTWLAQGDATIGADAALTNVFQNSGVFTRDTSAGVYAVAVPFQNTGIVNGVTGTLVFTAPVTTGGGSFDTIAGALISFAADSSFDSAAVFTGGGEVRLIGGIQTFVQSTVSSSGLTLVAGKMALPLGVVFDSNGIFHGAGGEISGPGALITNGGLDLSGSLALTDVTLNLPLGSTSTQTALGALTLNGAATVNNLGTYYAQNDGSISPGTGAGFAFNNSGTLIRDTGVGVFAMAVSFHNSGTVDVQTGTLLLSGGGTSTGVYQVAADTDLSLTGNTEFSGASTFTGAGRINFQSGTQTIADSMVSSAIVNLSGGVLSIAAAQIFDSAGTFRWSGGTVTGGGTLENSGNLNTIGAVILDGATFHTAATGVSSIEAAGSLVLKNSAILKNDGTFFLLNDSAIGAGDASALAFDNTGTVSRDTGAGVFSINVPFNHSGTVNLNSGTLGLYGGGTAANSVFNTQSGTVLDVGSNYTFGANNIMTGSGATHFNNGVLHVTGSLITDGSFNWAGGTLDGGGVFTVKGGLNITPGAGGVFINGSILENALGSEAVISGASATHIVNGGTYRNSGLTRLQGNNNFSDDGGGANSIVNSGTLIRDAGAGNYTITLPIHNTGTIRSSSGALLLNAGGTASAGALDADGGDIYLNGGNYEFSGGALTGSSFVYLTAGTALVTADTGAISGPATGGFGIAGGTFGGSAMLSVERGYFSTGTMTGTAVLRLTGASSKVNNTHFTMSGGTIQNDGSYSQGVEANWDLDNSDIAGGGTILNNGSWTLTAGCSFSNTYGGGSFDNAGTFDQAVGYNWMRPAFHNRATGVLNSTSNYILLAGGGSQTAGSILNANGGDIYFYGGTHQLNGGSFTGSSFTYSSLGTVSVNGDFGAASGAATGGFGVSGATITGTGMLSAERGYFSTGQISGDVVLRFTGASSKGNHTHLTLSGGTIQNDGSYSQGVEANWDLDNSDTAGGGTILNNGSWTLTAGSSFSNTYGGGTFDNVGTFHQAAGYSWMRPAFHNRATGVLNSNAGYILLAGGGSQTAGSILNADGGDIYFYGGTHQLNGGTFTGSSFTYSSLGTVSVNANVGAATGPATGGFGVSGATVTGTGMLSAERGYFSTGQISGDVVLRFTGASSKEINTHLGMSGGTIRNQGTFTQGTNANWDLDNSDAVGGGAIQNQGTWTLTSGSSFSNTYGGGSFDNPGILNQSSGENYLYAPFYNAPTGTLNATAGAIHLMGGGTHDAGSVLNAAGGNIYFRSGAHALNGCSLTGSSYAYAMAGTVTINQDVNATSGPATGGFSIYSYGGNAYVDGTAMLSVDHGYLESGTIAGSPVLRFTGASSKGDNTHLNMNGGTLRNEGTFTQKTNANYDLDGSNAAGGGTIQNIGIWEFTGSSNFSNTYGGGSISNSGTFSFLAGSNTIYPTFHNQATGVVDASVGNAYFVGNSTHAPGSLLNADAGAIIFQLGTHELDGASLTGSGWTYVYSGSVEITGDVNATSGPATGGFALYSNGGNASLGGTGMLSVERCYLASGFVTGDVVLRMTGTSSKGDYTHLYMNGGTIRNDGSFSQAYQANYDLDGSNAPGGGTLMNTGTWTLTNSSNFSNTNGGGVFSNSGTLNQAGGSNHIYAAFINQATGVLNATAGNIYLSGGGAQATGSVLNANGGDIYLNGGLFTMNQATISGSSSVYASGGTVHINENVGTTSGAATGGFGISGNSAIVTGTAMLSAERGYLGYGNISGSPVLRFTGASSKGNYTHLYMTGGTIQNEGVFTQDYQANYDLDNSPDAGGGTLLNKGIWNLTNSSSFANSQGGGVFSNQGTLNQSGGDNYIYGQFVNGSTGVVNATAGVVRWLGGGSLAVGNVLNANGGSIYFQGGTHEWNGGTITGTTTVYAVGGTVNINGDVGATTGAATGGFGISGNYATVTGTGTLSAERGELGYGNISGSPVLRFTGASSKASYTHLYMTGGTIQNDGVFTQDYQANYELDNSSDAGGGTLLNKGIWNLTNSSSFANSQGGGAFNNQGTLNQSGGNNYIYAPVTNSGTIHASAGILLLYGGSAHSGSLVTDSSIVLGAGTHSMAGATARLSGSGALSGNLSISDGAKIAPGSSPGTLTLYGNVGFITGGDLPACEFELASPSSHDQIAIADGATLDLGSNLTDLQVTLQYAPAYGDTFRIISAAGSGRFTGAFRNLAATDSIMTATYGAQSYSLVITYDALGKYVDLKVLTPYLAWAYGKGLHGLDSDFGSDPDRDGIVNGMEFVIGGEPNPANPDSNSSALLPQIVVDETYLRVIYRRHDDAIYLNPRVEYDADLAGAWTIAESDVNGVVIHVDDDGFELHIDRVEVRIPRSNEEAGKLFARLNAVEP